MPGKRLSFQARADLPPHERLSPREVQVLKLIAEGWRTHEIAAKLGVSYSTARTYRERIRDVAELANDREIIRYCWTAGLVGEP